MGIQTPEDLCWLIEGAWKLNPWIKHTCMWIYWACPRKLNPWNPAERLYIYEKPHKNFSTIGYHVRQLEDIFVIKPHPPTLKIEPVTMNINLTNYHLVLENSCQSLPKVGFQGSIFIAKSSAQFQKQQKCGGRARNLWWCLQPYSQLLRFWLTFDATAAVVCK